MSGTGIPIPADDITDLQDRVLALEQIQTNYDTFFMMINATLVFFMQAGFVLIVAGSVRTKHTTSVILKNYVDTVFCGIGYWIFGYALAFGANPNTFCGTRNWAGEILDPKLFVKWYYQFSFASTAATIVSGAIAERCRLEAYMIYSFMVSAFIYPIQSHWVWDPAGWLAKGDGIAAFQDYAGSGVVHLCGGSISIVAAYITGPRIGRFTGKQAEDPITHHNVPLFALGGFILFVGFMSFNASSGQSITLPGDGVAVGNAVRNTVISGSFGTVVGMFVSKIISNIKTKGRGKYSLFATVNCGLCGMVAICAGCNIVYDWGAAIIGTISALSYFFWSWLMVRLKIDDAVDAVAVHLGAGLCGVLLQPILKKDGLVFRANDPVAWRYFAWSLCGSIAIIVWSAGTSAIIFLALKYLNFLRVDPKIERQGMDLAHMMEPSYPEAVVGPKIGLPAISHGFANNYPGAFRNMAAARNRVAPEVARGMIRRPVPVPNWGY